ncbi:hypothetical protein NX81_003290 [Xanthomonas vasicola]|nr:hypothetical protein NX81_003290 [Xanthomonas vasicola]
MARIRVPPCRRMQATAALPAAIGLDDHPFDAGRDKTNGLGLVDPTPVACCRRGSRMRYLNAGKL